MSEIDETVTLNESNGILYCKFHGSYGAIVNPEDRERLGTYKVTKAEKVNKKTYYLTLGEKVTATASFERKNNEQSDCDRKL